MQQQAQLDTGIKPAPGDLALVQALINTKDIEGKRDKLLSPDLLKAWLLDVGLIDKSISVTADDLHFIIELREAFRALLVAKQLGKVGNPPKDTLNEITKRVKFILRFNDSGESFLVTEDTGVLGAIGRLLGITHTSMVDGSWSRLKACKNDICHWIFYDSSKNRSGVWCDMAVCGSRLKARAYRKRQSI